MFRCKRRFVRHKNFKIRPNILDSNKTYDLAIGHSACEKNAQFLRKALYQSCANIKSISILEIGCALGAHTGPGTLAVGIQEHLSI